MDGIKWICTFGLGCKLLKDKYVICNGDIDSARTYMYDNYGQDNCCSFYPYEYGMESVEKYGWKLLEEVNV